MNLESPSSAEVSRFTSLTLIDRLRNREPEGWLKFCRIYGPLVYGWARRSGLQSTDAADVVQEVFLVVARRIEEFQRVRERNFRNWLWTICHHTMQAHFRRIAERPQAEGGTTAHIRVSQLSLSPDFADDSEHDDRLQVVTQVLSVLRSEVQHSTWQAFWRTTIEGEEPLLVATELGMTRWAIYKIKARMLHRLRTELEGLASISELLNVPPADSRIRGES